MPAVTRKMTALKDEILSIVDQKFNQLELEFPSDLKDQVKKRGFWTYQNWNQKTCRTGINSIPAVGAHEELSEART